MFLLMMGFPDKLRKEVMIKTHFHCCWCLKLGLLEVHHIIPQADGGKSSIDNAAPLCPYCHTLIGNNPDHRKAIKWRRDWWYEQCARREAAAQTQTISLRAEDIDLLSKRINEQMQDNFEISFKKDRGQ